MSVPFTSLVVRGSKLSADLVRDSTWHGTDVAGLIAGIAHDAKAQPIRVSGRRRRR
ncbi:hypothetical protein ACFWRV_07700 [Streptomyces sp. NPDC058576]|uniref:hypothetical protein n=1 Tax=Streptomyces sp. NPDC058576 TaxID=3346547 RepID=UPI003666F33F